MKYMQKYHDETKKNSNKSRLVKSRILMRLANKGESSLNDEINMRLASKGC